MSKIIDIDALEILDSRGFPTIRTTVLLEDGTSGVAMVPSGASTGEREAFELRDKDKKRYQGKGVLRAVSNVREKIMPALLGLEVHDQSLIDETLLLKRPLEQMRYYLFPLLPLMHPQIQIAYLCLRI